MIAASSSVCKKDSGITGSVIRETPSNYFYTHDLIACAAAIKCQAGGTAAGKAIKTSNTDYIGGNKFTITITISHTIKLPYITCTMTALGRAFINSPEPQLLVLQTLVTVQCSLILQTFSHCSLITAPLKVCCMGPVHFNTSSLKLITS